MQIVEFIVGVFDGTRGLQVAVEDGVRGFAPNDGSHFAHALDESATTRRHFTTQTARRAPRDVLGQITVALYFGQNP